MRLQIIQNYIKLYEKEKCTSININQIDAIYIRKILNYKSIICFIVVLIFYISVIYFLKFFFMFIVVTAVLFIALYIDFFYKTIFKVVIQYENNTILFYSNDKNINEDIVILDYLVKNK